MHSESLNANEPPPFSSSGFCRNGCHNGLFFNRSPSLHLPCAGNTSTPKRICPPSRSCPPPRCTRPLWATQRKSASAPTRRSLHLPQRPVMSTLDYIHPGHDSNGSNPWFLFRSRLARFRRSVDDAVVGLSICADLRFQHLLQPLSCL